MPVLHRILVLCGALWLGDVCWSRPGSCVRAGPACPESMLVVSAWYCFWGSLRDAALWLQVGPAFSGYFVGPAQGGDLNLKLSALGASRVLQESDLQASTVATTLSGSGLMIETLKQSRGGGQAHVASFAFYFSQEQEPRKTELGEIKGKGLQGVKPPSQRWLLPVYSVVTMGPGGCFPSFSLFYIGFHISLSLPVFVFVCVCVLDFYFIFLLWKGRRTKA